MDVKVRMPGPLWRAAVAKAGGMAGLNARIVQAVSDYVNDREPAREFGRMGGQARTAGMTPEERSALARKAGLASGKARAKTDAPPDSSSD